MRQFTKTKQKKTPTHTESQELLMNLVKAKGLSINWKKYRMYGCQRKKQPKMRIINWRRRNEALRKLKYLGCIFTEDRKCDGEIQR